MAGGAVVVVGAAVFGIVATGRAVVVGSGVVVVVGSGIVVGMSVSTGGTVDGSVSSAEVKISDPGTEAVSVGSSVSASETWKVLDARKEVMAGCSEV